MDLTIWLIFYWTIDICIRLFTIGLLMFAPDYLTWWWAALSALFCASLCELLCTLLSAFDYLTIWLLLSAFDYWTIELFNFSTIRLLDYCWVHSTIWLGGEQRSVRCSMHHCVNCCAHYWVHSTIRLFDYSTIWLFNFWTIWLFDYFTIVECIRLFDLVVSKDRRLVCSANEVPSPAASCPRGINASLVRDDHQH